MGMTLDQWRSTISELFTPLSVLPLGAGHFHADATSIRVHDAGLTTIRTSSQRVSRELVDAPTTSHLKMSLQLSGTAVIRQDGRETRLSPGDMAVYVTGRPYELEFPGEQECLVVHIPESHLQLASSALLPDLTAVPIREGRGLGTFVVPVFRQLATNFHALSSRHAPRVITSAVDLISTALASEIGDVASPTRDAALWQRAVNYIDANLHDPELSPTKVAGALYVSVRHLHGRFAARDLTVASYIRDRRLEAIRRDLANPALGSDTVRTIAARHGLHDPSYVSKAFRNAYGCSPSDYRMALTR